MDNAATTTGGDDIHKELASVRFQLQAQIARSTQLHGRLTSAMDAMETLQINYSRELNAERETRKRLNQKLERLTEYTQAVEEERDELRDAALALVERVEGRDESSWPYSRIRLVNALEPLQRSLLTADARHGESSVPSVSDYNAAIVANLRTELERERRAHAQTHDRAELEVLCLRSQLARRDAELHACVAHPDHSAILTETNQLRIKSKSTRQSPSRLTPDATTRILDHASVRNRDLENEVERLVARLHQTHTVSRSSSPRLASGASSPSTSSKKRAQVSRASPIPNVITPPQRSPPSPNLEPHRRHDSPSPYTMTPRYPDTPHRRHPIQSMTATDGATIAAGRHQPRSSNPLLADFGDELKRLSDEIDNFKGERQRWRQTLDTESEGALISTTKVDSPAQDIESKATLGKASRDDLAALRAEFEAFRDATAGREAELCAEIAALRESRRLPLHLDETETLVAPSRASDKPLFLGIDAVPVGNAEPVELPTARAIAPQAATPTKQIAEHVDEDDDGEQSMDLGTPLQPMMTLHNGDTINIVCAPAHPEPAAPDIGPATQESPRIDPAMIALPETPIPDSRPTSPPSPPAVSDRAAIIRERPPTPFELSFEVSVGLVDDAGEDGDVSRQDQSITEGMRNGELSTDDREPPISLDSIELEESRVTGVETERMGGDVVQGPVVEEHAT